MAILKASVINGMSGDGDKKIINYSPRRENFFHEGVTIALETNTAEGWIGNFDDKHRGTSLSPFVSKKGVAFVFAGPYCYIVTGFETNSFKIREAFEHDVWVQCCFCSKDGVALSICGSKKGKILVLDGLGNEKSTMVMDVCEDMRLEISSDGFLIGKYFEFNLKKWIDFRYSLPDLKEN